MLFNLMFRSKKDKAANNAHMATSRSSLNKNIFRRKQQDSAPNSTEAHSVSVFGIEEVESTVSSLLFFFSLNYSFLKAEEALSRQASSISLTR